MVLTGESEIMLQKMPTCLRIEITEGRDEPLLYDLKSEYVIWSRDVEGNAKMKRRDFRLVPDFVNTAHGYCGDTLDKYKGDLFEWSKVPALEARLSNPESPRQTNPSYLGHIAQCFFDRTLLLVLTCYWNAKKER